MSQALTCARCSGKDHSESDCTSPAAGMTQPECFKCRGFGHFARDCPCIKKDQCFNCKEFGHHSLDCTNPGGPKYKGARSRSPPRDYHPFRQSSSSYSAPPSSSFSAGGGYGAPPNPYRLPCALCASGDHDTPACPFTSYYAEIAGKYLASRGIDLRLVLETGNPPPPSNYSSSNYPPERERRSERPYDAASNPNTKCFQCAQTGHTAVTCPNSSGMDKNACYKCGETGHRASACSSQRDIRTCFVCHQSGHTSRECPDARK